jgi:hypothetical protein
MSADDATIDRAVTADRPWNEFAFEAALSESTSLHEFAAYPNVAWRATRIGTVIAARFD